MWQSCNSQLPYPQARVPASRGRGVRCLQSRRLGHRRESDTAGASEPPATQHSLITVELNLTLRMSLGHSLGTSGKLQHLPQELVFPSVLRQMPDDWMARAKGLCTGACCYGASHRRRTFTGSGTGANLNLGLRALGHGAYHAQRDHSRLRF